MKTKNIEDEDEVIRLYTIEKISIANIAKMLKINQKTISKFLKSKNIKIKYIFTEEHKEKMRGLNPNKNKDKKGKKLSIEHNYKNMSVHLRYDVDYLWLMQFENFEKLKFLNLNVTKDRDFKFDTDIYKNYILKFYYDDNFNNIYDKWIKNNKNKWLRPSLDHIIPRSKNNNTDNKLDNIDNLRFLTWFENRCKCDIDIYDWYKMKKDIYYYFS